MKPNSRTNEIDFDANENIIVKIAATPQDGKANGALIEFLSKAFHIPKSMIKIISGVTNQYKRLEFPEEYANEIHSAIKKYGNNKGD